MRTIGEGLRELAFLWQITGDVLIVACDFLEMSAHGQVRIENKNWLLANVPNVVYRRNEVRIAGNHDKAICREAGRSTG